jgi:hypothetical protein
LSNAELDDTIDEWISLPTELDPSLSDGFRILFEREVGWG